MKYFTISTFLLLVIGQAFAGDFANSEKQLECKLLKKGQSAPVTSDSAKLKKTIEHEYCTETAYLSLEVEEGFNVTAAATYNCYGEKSSLLVIDAQQFGKNDSFKTSVAIIGSVVPLEASTTVIRENDFNKIYTVQCNTF